MTGRKRPSPTKNLTQLLLGGYASVIEAPTSPRTRITTHAQRLRPLSSQMFRAAVALAGDDLNLIRTETARTYYKLGEMNQLDQTLIDYPMLKFWHSQIELLFNPSVSNEDIDGAKAALKECLFRIEGIQPSSLTLYDISHIQPEQVDSFSVYDFAAFRLAAGLRRAALALLSLQLDLCIAYLDFFWSDVFYLRKNAPSFLDQDVFECVKELHEQLLNTRVEPRLVRPLGRRFLKTITPYLERHRLSAHNL